MFIVYDDVTSVYDDVTSVYDDVTYNDVTEILVFIGTCSATTAPAQGHRGKIFVSISMISV